MTTKEVKYASFKLQIEHRYILKYKIEIQI